MKRNLLQLLVLLLWPACMMMAQNNINMKFGKPTKEEMQMTVYDADPNAEAVVLCRLTDVEYTIQQTGYLVDYREKVRIKVLKPSGARFAKVVIPFLKETPMDNSSSNSKMLLKVSTIDNNSVSSTFDEQAGAMTTDALANYSEESVEDLKATAYNLQGSKVVKSNLKKDAIVETKIDDQHYQVEFTVPDVKEGTVIEYEYVLHSELFWLLHDWFAQGEIPVVYAKLDMNIPRYLLFNLEEHGIQRLTCSCTPGSMRYKLVSDPLSNPVVMPTNHYVCVGRNLAGVKKDEYVWNVQDYCAGVTAELKEFSMRGATVVDYLKTWEQIDAMVFKSEDLGKQLKNHSPLARELNEAKIAEIADLRQRTEAVCKLVFSKVGWNGRYEMSPADTEETLKHHGGSNVDINMLLIQSLNDVGLTAAPVVLRMRDQGLLPQGFPSLQKLSTFIVGVVLPTGNIYLDASSEKGYLNVLAEPLQVEKARLVLKENKSQWVDLQQLSRSQKQTTITAQLSADGVLKGRQTTHYEGLAAMNYRQAKGIRAFASEAVEETDLTVKGQTDGGIIRICPFTASMAHNAFIESERMIPVEFPSISTETIVLNITLPKGYTFGGHSRNTSLATPDKGLECLLQTTATGGKIQMTCQLRVNKLIYYDKNYKDLRQIFEMIAAYTSEELVVKK